MGSNNGKPSSTVMHYGFLLKDKRPLKECLLTIHVCSNIAIDETTMHMFDLTVKYGWPKSYCVLVVVVLITIDTGSSNDCNECHQCSIVVRWLIIIWDLPHNRQYRHIVCLYCCAISQGYVRERIKEFIWITFSLKY